MELLHTRFRERPKFVPSTADLKSDTAAERVYRIRTIQTSLKHSVKAKCMPKQNNVGAQPVHSNFRASINCFVMDSLRHMTRLAVICKTVLKKMQKKCDTALLSLTSFLTYTVMGEGGVSKTTTNC